MCDTGSVIGRKAGSRNLTKHDVYHGFIFTGSSFVSTVLRLILGGVLGTTRTNLGTVRDAILDPGARYFQVCRQRGVL